MSGQVNPSDATIPFFAFLPDNHFLRNENLVPIHIVKSLDDDSSFINVATPKRQEWERFLGEAGYWRTTRGKGDHERWVNSYAGLPPLTINYRNNELDFNSFKSSLKALGIKQVDYQVFRNTKKLPDSLVKKFASDAG